MEATISPVRTVTVPAVGRTGTLTIRNDSGGIVKVMPFPVDLRAGESVLIIGDQVVPPKRILDERLASLTSRLKTKR